MGARRKSRYCRTPRCVQGNVTYKKMQALGPYHGPMLRFLGGPRGVDVFLWARYSCMLAVHLFGRDSGTPHCFQCCKDDVKSSTGVPHKKTHPRMTLP